MQGLSDLHTAIVRNAMAPPVILNERIDAKVYGQKADRSDPGFTQAREGDPCAVLRGKALEAMRRDGLAAIVEQGLKLAQRDGDIVIALMGRDPPAAAAL